MLQTGVPKSRYQIHLKSTNGSICVLLVNRESSNDQPVVVSVPPADSKNNNEMISEPEDNVTSSTKMKDRISSETISGITESSGNLEIIFISYSTINYDIGLPYLFLFE